MASNSDLGVGSEYEHGGELVRPNFWRLRSLPHEWLKRNRLDKDPSPRRSREAYEIVARRSLKQRGIGFAARARSGGCVGKLAYSFEKKLVKRLYQVLLNN